MHGCVHSSGIVTDIALRGHLAYCIIMTALICTTEWLLFAINIAVFPSSYGNTSILYSHCSFRLVVLDF